MLIIQIILFVTLPIISILFLKSLEVEAHTYLYLAGISILGSSIHSVQRATPIKYAYTLTSLLYIASVVLLIWGLFVFEWYMVLVAAWVLSYYLYFIRRIVWLRLYVNGNTGLELLNWDNVYIIMGIILSLWGLICTYQNPAEETSTNKMVDENKIIAPSDSPKETSIRETFRVNLDTQSVEVLSIGKAPVKLSNCSVKDSKNWSCTTWSDDVEFGYKMVNGTFEELP